jgi:hypothetical protein
VRRANKKYQAAIVWPITPADFKWLINGGADSGSAGLQVKRFQPFENRSTESAVGKQQAGILQCHKRAWSPLIIQGFNRWLSIWGDAIFNRAETARFQGSSFVSTWPSESGG